MPVQADGRHGYQAYRSCLRWDFGFTCSFCLLHEGDLADFGGEGLGVMWIEHLIPASRETDGINDYGNCFYACRFCNRSRSRAPLIDEVGRKLLDPCSCVWNLHFTLSDDDLLLADESDSDAIYTQEAYDLNDPRKVRRRRIRRERLTEWLSVIRHGLSRVEALIALSQRVAPQDAAFILDEALALRQRIKLAKVEVLRYLAVPGDSDKQCSCARENQCTLPVWLDTQTLELPIEVILIQE
jgi:hypothetical protein